MIQVVKSNKCSAFMAIVREWGITAPTFSVRNVGTRLFLQQQDAQPSIIVVLPDGNDEHVQLRRFRR